jgi:hypothetical protein
MGESRGRPRMPRGRTLLRASLRAVRPDRGTDVSLRRSLDAAYRWLCAAQDATADDGVAAAYSLIRGWMPSYPETTGYIIPTFLTCAKVMSIPEAQERALRMAEWEIDVQMPSGAVRSGTLGTEAAPAIFNTGQVLFGWIAAYEATGEERFAQAARRAAEWLAGQQDTDGAWRRNLSLLTTSSVQTYNVRSAWGLALAGRALDEPRWIEAARRNCDWALAQQLENGWFKNNGFSDTEDPLLHTIGYALEGMLGVGELLNEQRFIDAAVTGMRPLVEIRRRSGRLRGRYRSNWDASVAWRCLTGEAQVGLVLLRLAKRVPEERVFIDTARAILEDLARVQDTDSPYPETWGAIGGSQPLWGRYCPLSFPNWAAKFYLDGLLLCLSGADVQHLPGAGRSHRES